MSKDSTTGKEISVGRLWTRLERVVKNIKEEYPKNRNQSMMVGQAAIAKQDPEILPLLREKVGLRIEDDSVLKTWAGLIRGYLTIGGGGFIVVSILATCVHRFRLTRHWPIGVHDLIAIFATRIFWQVQEWAVHSHWFHGNKDGRAGYRMFKKHDRHHDLPYYH